MRVSFSFSWHLKRQISNHAEIVDSGRHYFHPRQARLVRQHIHQHRAAPEVLAPVQGAVLMRDEWKPFGNAPNQSPHQQTSD